MIIYILYNNKNNMFADIVKFISLNNLSKNAQFIIFGGTVIVDEPICKDEPEHYFTNCIDNWG
jgi:hypothetical protein